jgi:hypothetical protein
MFDRTRPRGRRYRSSSAGRMSIASGRRGSGGVYEFRHRCGFLSGCGAFLDVGVHQDALVHISATSNSFVRDPRAGAKPAAIVCLKLLEVDPKRHGISLTMHLDGRPAERNDRWPPPKLRRFNLPPRAAPWRKPYSAPASPAAIRLSPPRWGEGDEGRSEKPKKSWRF